MPFNLDNDISYQGWKQNKLANYPTTLSDLLVEINDPFAMSSAEINAILSRCAKSNMALYRLTNPETNQVNPLPAITSQLGLTELDKNLGAGETGVSALTPGGSAYNPFATYIPYRQAPIGWHTDGYYNLINRQVNALCLYCEHPSETGGENELLDHEIIYMQLRDQNPEFIRTLMEPKIMTIPPRMNEDGTIGRPARPGPVFSITDAGKLHMRFTNRTISIHWQEGQKTQEALAALRQICTTPSPYIFRGRLERGWGLISNNVLHTRNAFTDSQEKPKRTLYRARFIDRLP